MNINNYKIKDLEKAFTLIFENAKELIEESEILLTNERFARSYTLSHIASEELSKLPILFRVATDIHFKIKVDWKNVNKDLRDHEGKLRRKFMQQQILSNPKGINDALLNFIKEKAKHYNTLKNDSLYAGICNGEFTKPSHTIDREIAEANIQVVKEELKLHEVNKYHLIGFSKALAKVNKQDFLSLTFRDTNN
ncbi:AbiV family abortive infection protein [Bacillus cereus group sp. TH152-1LC]|uniref:AbiV family abortive infection protein n=1 Tax=Bacillus cereus group sp. TH152-1LC TaxID=3018060 RepID=UPI0022E05827|nr:AbiV family abortive infection protein [Bacillus cereus group sp. TH152-1LC]MDA1677033.1 AbiV family abortive infection protein [Bacillus cereus group sp. TH152-1LC]